MEEGEVWIVSSPNLMTERDSEKIAWNLLPEGERGIRNPDFVNESRPLVGRVSGRLAALRLYWRPLRTCEVLGACRSFGDLEFQPVRKTDAKE